MKTRDLPRVLGYKNNLYYRNWGYGLPHGLTDEQLIKKFYDEAAMTSYQLLSTCPSTLGTQSFESTYLPRPWMNSCFNRKSFYVNYPYLCYGKSYTGSLSSTCPCWAYTRTNTSGTLVNITDHAGTGMLSQASARAWNTMQPRFEGEIDMFNFLFEFKDFRQLLRNGVKLVNYFRQYRRRSGFNPLTDRRLKNISPTERSTKTAASGWLTYYLAIAPLVKDLCEIVTQMRDTVAAAQSRFKCDGEEVQKSHYSELFHEEAGTWSPLGAKNYYLMGQSNSMVKKTIFTATMRYTYQYRCREALSAFQTHWRLTPSWNTVWNCLPFSFTLDYIIGLGDSIKAMERDRNVDLNLNDYCESLLTLHESGTFTVVDPRAYAYIINGMSFRVDGTQRRLLSGASSSLYNRWRCDPNKGMYVPKFKVPSGRQMLTGLALLRTIL